MEEINTAGTQVTVAAAARNIITKDQNQQQKNKIMKLEVPHKHLPQRKITFRPHQHYGMNFN